MLPFIDLAAQYQHLKEPINRRIQQVLAHGQYIMGPEVAELEQQLASFVGVKHVITCANGTDALHLALLALNIGPGDAVLTTPFTFMATAEVVRLVGATPVFVDIDARTYNLDPDKLAQRLLALQQTDTVKAKAVIAVDLLGLPANYPALAPLCQQHGLYLIEDAAQGLGSAIHGKRAGSYGDLATTSFFPAKPLGCYGDGGALFTNNDGLAASLRSLRVHGKGAHKYDNVRIGMNSRLDTLQAAILLEKLAVFEQEIQARQRIAAVYTSCLTTRTKSNYQVPFIPEGYRSVWAQYSILANEQEQRTQAMANLKRAGIPTNIYYPTPLHLQPAFAELGHQPGDFPVSERVAQCTFSLPMHPYLDIEAILPTLANI